MAKISRFEDLGAWQKARLLTKHVYALTRESSFSKDRALKTQIRRASVSIMSNIAEGFGRQGDTEFFRFLYMARGSVYEVKSQLYVALDAQFLNEEVFKEIYDLADETARMIGGLMRYLKKD